MLKSRMKKNLIKSLFFSILGFSILSTLIFLIHYFSPNIKTYTIIHISVIFLITIILSTISYIAIKDKSKLIKHVKEKLNKTETKFTMIYENTPVIMFTVNTKLNITDVNKKFVNKLGFTKNEVINKKLTSFATKESKIILNNKLLNKLNDKKSIDELQIDLITKDNDIIQTLINVKVLKINEKTNLGLCVAIDITEQCRIEREKEKLISKLEDAVQKAEEVARLKSEFISMVTHELKTPLTSMLGFSEILFKDESKEVEVQKIGKVIYRSGKKLLDIFSEIIELSVIESGELIITKELFNIEEVVDEIYFFLKDLITIKNISFEKINIENVKIYSDMYKVRQILFYVINNAIKYTDTGGIKIILEVKNNEYLFKVVDTGIGIKEENEKIIFEMFRQAEEVFSRKYGGIGLGLTISKKLVEALGGKLWAENRKDVQGSIFYISLPRDKEEEELNN